MYILTVNNVVWKQDGTAAGSSEKVEEEEGEKVEDKESLPEEVAVEPQQESERPDASTTEQFAEEMEVQTEPVDKVHDLNDTLIMGGEQDDLNNVAAFQEVGGGGQKAEDISPAQNQDDFVELSQNNIKGRKRSVTFNEPEEGEELRMEDQVKEEPGTASTMQHAVQQEAATASVPNFDARDGNEALQYLGLVSSAKKAKIADRQPTPKRSILRSRRLKKAK